MISPDLSSMWRLAVPWQVTPYGLSRFAEGSPGLEVLDVLAADKGGAESSCLTFESMFVVAANCPHLKVGGCAWAQLCSLK